MDLIQHQKEIKEHAHVQQNIELIKLQKDLVYVFQDMNSKKMMWIYQMRMDLMTVYQFHIQSVEATNFGIVLEIVKKKTILHAEMQLVEKMVIEKRIQDFVYVLKTKSLVLIKFVIQHV